MTLTAWWASGGHPITLKDKKRWTLLLGLGLLGVAMLGMTGAITALGDTLFPAKSLAEGLAQDNDPNAHFLIRLRIYHPIIAIFVGVYTFTLVGYVRGKFGGVTRKLSLVLGGVVATQLAIGIINLLLLAPIVMQIIHLLMADMVWISYILLAASILSIHEKPLTEETA
jgi:heme A synthase